MQSMQDGRVVSRLPVLFPAMVMVIIVIISLWLADGLILGLLVVVPLLASNVTGPVASAGYGVASLACAAAIGLVDQVYTQGSDRLRAQLVRLAAITLMSVVGAFMARYRLRREAQLSRMRKVAEAAQKAILLPLPERVGPARIAVHYESAATDALIGGDLYGTVLTPYGLRILVGDVRGKGLEAVSLAAQVLATFRERASDDADLAVLTGHLDRTVARVGDDEDFVTAVLAELTAEGQVRFVIAGHPSPVAVTGGRARFLNPERPRPPLGLDLPGCGEGADGTVRITLDAGDRLLLYTDGLTEARDAYSRAFLPTDLVTDAVSGCEGIVDAVRNLRDAALRWTHGDLNDDIALVLVEYQPAEVPLADQVV